MNEKELDTRFQEAVDIPKNDSGIFTNDVSYVIVWKRYSYVSM
jgi:hypothetical protein